MIGGSTRKFGTTALLAVSVAGLATTAPANAADLGGNCCADLEERIAELEATTVRKGNRKVSLELYGQVNEAILFWDDGGEDNAYVVTNDNSRTRFGVRGKAKISDDWEAGYRIELGIRAVNSKRFDQLSDEGVDQGIDLRDSFWYLKSKTYGTVSLGQTASATDQITEINLSQTRDFSKYSDVEDSGLGLLLRSSVNGNLTGSGLSWRRLIGDAGDQPGEGERRFNLVKYDSPTFKGFSVSAAWGEDDFWDVGLRYTGDHAGFKIAAGIGYFEINNGDETQTACNATTGTAGQDINQECHQFGGSVSVLHEATGLFVNVAAGQKVDDLIHQTARFSGTGVDDSQEFWAIQAGLEKKFFEHGKTTIYGEYYDYEGGGNSRRTVDGPDGGVADALNPFAAGGDGAVWGTGVEMWGAGIAQGFDKAALVLYLSYRHYESELTLRQLNGGVANGDIANAPLEDLDVLLTGGIIKF